MDQARQRVAALDRTIADLTAEQQALVSSVEESKARRANAIARQNELAARRDEFDRERREQQERVAGARASARANRYAGRMWRTPRCGGQ